MSQFLTNHYDIIYKKPALEGKKMPKKLEALAQKLVSSGLMRISADERCNFFIYPVISSKKHLTFTLREITDKNLLKKTRKILKHNLPKHEQKQKPSLINHTIGIIREKIEMYLEIPDDHEMKLARMVVQCCPSVIISNMIIEGVEIFISFSNTISDLLDVKSWQSNRSSQGLQSTAGNKAAVFISCGGNPFFDPEESKNDYDGDKAISRFMTVGAQEIGHYADLIKDKFGNNIGRFSAELNLSAPNFACDKARRADMKRVDLISEKAERCKINAVYNFERAYNIQEKFNNKAFSIKLLWMRFRVYIAHQILRRRLINAKIHCINEIYKMKGDFAHNFLLCCGDMAFNLNPASSAYRNENKSLEKAIFCAEALARIPQQEVKWGNKVVNYFTPNLQRYFYQNIIPEEIEYNKMLRSTIREV